MDEIKSASESSAEFLDTVDISNTIGLKIANQDASQEISENNMLPDEKRAKKKGKLKIKSNKPKKKHSNPNNLKQSLILNSTSNLTYMKKRILGKDNPGDDSENENEAERAKRHGWMASLVGYNIETYKEGDCITVSPRRTKKHSHSSLTSRNHFRSIDKCQLSRDRIGGGSLYNQRDQSLGYNSKIVESKDKWNKSMYKTLDPTLPLMEKNTLPKKNKKKSSTNRIPSDQTSPIALVKKLTLGVPSSPTKIVNSGLVPTDLSPFGKKLSVPIKKKICPSGKNSFDLSKFSPNFLKSNDLSELRASYKCNILTPKIERPSNSKFKKKTQPKAFDLKGNDASMTYTEKADYLQKLLSIDFKRTDHSQNLNRNSEASSKRRKVPIGAHTKLHMMMRPKYDLPDIEDNSTGLTELNDGEVGSDSLYSLLFDFEYKNHLPLACPSQYIKEMAHIFRDFDNRFPSGTPLPSRFVTLPKAPKNKRFTLILDLDETLIHCSFKDAEGSSIKLPLKQDSKGKVLISANLFIRPYAIEFLEDLSEVYEVLVFTSSHKYYARSAVKILDPKMKYINFLLTREHCNFQKKLMIKDLRVISNRQLENLLIVDNCVGGFANQIENGIPIIPFEGDPTDTELPVLKEYLLNLAKIAGDNNKIAELNGNILNLKQVRYHKEPIEYIREVRSAVNLMLSNKN